MSEAPAEQPNEPNESQGGQQGEPADKPLGENGEKALRAERERAKELEKQLSAASTRLSEIERANESAIEKAQREAKEAQDALPTGITAAFRDAAVTFGGIDAEDADLFLTGSDVETLKKQAARLVNRTPAAPKPDPSQGGKGTTAKGSTADQFAAAISDALN